MRKLPVGQILLYEIQKMCLDAASRLTTEGRCARSSRHARRGCGGREASQHARACRRTMASRTWNRVVLAFRC